MLPCTRAAGLRVPGYVSPRTCYAMLCLVYMNVGCVTFRTEFVGNRRLEFSSIESPSSDVLETV